MNERGGTRRGRIRTGAVAPAGIPPRDAAAGLRVRRAALEVLLRVEQRGAFADVLLGHRLRAFVTAADRRLVTQLVLGTIAWRGRLDYELARVSSRKLVDLTPQVLAVLRMGLYQLRYLTRIPHHAAVDTAVDLARDVGNPGATRFVNAVLRSAIRGPATLPERSCGEMEYLAVAYSHPKWLVERFVDWFGVADAEAFMAANNAAAPNVLRLNLTRGSADALIARIERDGMRVDRRGRFPETLVLGGAALFDSPCYREGIVQSQSEASQFVARLLGPRLGGFVVDCAAAPGGKAAHLAQMIEREGKVIALDVNLAGLKNVRTLAQRLEHRNILSVRADCTDALPLRPKSAEFVLLDAPCTGLGTLRQHPELRWRLEPSDIARMAVLQTAMIENAAALVSQNGALVYAVCSVAPEEGPDVIRRFVLRHPEFEIDRRPPSASELGDALDDSGCVRTRPDRGGLDGFFAARLRRRS